MNIILLKWLLKDKVLAAIKDNNLALLYDLYIILSLLNV